MHYLICYCNLLNRKRINNKVQLLNSCKEKRLIYSFTSLSQWLNKDVRKQLKYNHFPSSLLSPCLLRYFYNLQNLSLAYCRKFTDKGLQYLNLGNGCHKLIYLDLSGCTQVCLSAFSFLQQAKKSSREPAASSPSPHVILTLCTDCSTLFRRFSIT